jgi:long-chain acyl-CoA synthetase
MKFEEWTSLPAMFFENAALYHDRPFLWAKKDGRYKGRSYGKAAEQVSLLARGLEDCGLGVGDRVVLVSENRPEWAIAHFAIMAFGGITVPAYVTNTPDDHQHVISNVEARAVIVSNRRLLGPVLKAVGKLDSVKTVILMEDGEAEMPAGVELLAMDDVMQRGSKRPDLVIDRLRRLKRTDAACIIHTSGTGGLPKGVTLSHGAILCNCMGAHDLLLEFGLEHEVFLSFLPLSHSYEHLAGLIFPVSIGAEVYYAESIDKLAANMLEVKPTIMTAVPRLYETMRGRIMRGLESAGGAKRTLFTKTLALGRKKYETPAKLTPIDRLADRVLDKLVRDKVRARFGGRLKALVSGGGPLNYDVGLFFTSLGLTILQGYGQTEAAPVISANRPGSLRIESVGPPLKDVKVEIARDGEILVQGELVMQGYWNDPDSTAAAIDENGWLHTGDIGRIDMDGHIVITDRKKDIIVNSGGDNISPQRVEGILSLEPEVAQVMVYGDRHPHLVALVVPDEEFMNRWAAENHKVADLALLAEDPDFAKAFGPVLSRVNEKLSSIERVRKVLVADAPFTVDNEQMTPTMKVRRHILKQVYGKKLEALYA